MMLLPSAMVWLSSLLYAAEPTMPRVALQDPVDATALARIMTTIGRPPLMIAVRVPIDLERSTTPPADTEARLASYEARGVQLWPVIALPSDQAGAGRWRALLQQWIARHRRHLAVLELRVPEDALPFAGFALQRAATD
jgi:hypothetical protein